MPPSPSPAVHPLHCHGILCTDAELAEVDAGHVMVFAPRPEIRSITLRHGTQARHPLAQLLLGAALTALGYFPLWHLVHWLRHGGVFVETGAWLLVFPVVGVWLVLGTLKRGYFLDVELANATKRLAFHRAAPLDQIEPFLGEVERRYGVQIGRAVG